MRLTRVSDRLQFMRFERVLDFKLTVEGKYNSWMHKSMTTSALDGQLPRLTVPIDLRPSATVRYWSLEANYFLGSMRAISSSAEAILLGCEIDEALRSSLDVLDNRMSRRHYFDLFSNLCRWEKSIITVLNGATVVELGCGSINPFGLLFLFLMLGAQRAFAFDLDEIQSGPRAAKALADIAAMVLVDPHRFVW